MGKAFISKGRLGDFFILLAGLTLLSPAFVSQLPVLQFIQNQIGLEGQQLFFLVQADDPNGTTSVLSTAPLSAGVVFTYLAVFFLGSNPAAEDHSPTLPEITAPKGGAEVVLLQPDLVIEKSTILLGGRN